MILRVRYSKVGTASFLSHLELIVVMERILRRAKIPLAFSRGFNPHPKISYGAALSVGLASESEYLDLELTREVEPEDFLVAFNEKTIPGIGAIDAKRLVTKGKSLTALIERAGYRCELSLIERLSVMELSDLIASFLNQDEIIVTRQTKKGSRQMDIKSGLLEMNGEVLGGSKITLRFLVVAGSSGNIRAHEVWQAFEAFSKLKLFTEPYFVREDLFALKDGKLYSPMQVLEG